MKRGRKTDISKVFGLLDFCLKDATAGAKPLTAEQLIKAEKAPIRANAYNSENYLQKKCFAYFLERYPSEGGLLFHVPNEARRSFSNAMLMKSMGVTAGVSDFIYFTPRGRVVCIELKTETGRQSESQKQWQRAVESVGIRYVLVRSFYEFVALIENIHTEL